MFQLMPLTTIQMWMHTPPLNMISNDQQNTSKLVNSIFLCYIWLQSCHCGGCIQKKFGISALYLVSMCSLVFLIQVINAQQLYSLVTYKICIY